MSSLFQKKKCTTATFEIIYHLRRETLKKLNHILCDEERLHLYLDIAGSLVVSLNRDQIVTYINKRGADIIGLPQEEIVGKNYFDHFVRPASREKGRQRFVALFDSDETDTSSFEATVLTTSGDIRVVNWTNSPLRDADDNIVEIISSGNDITLRMQALTRLQESERKYKALIEATDTGYSIVDEQGYLIDANPKYVVLTGYETLDEIKGKHVISWIAPYDVQRFIDQLQFCLCDDSVSHSEFDMLTKNGTIIPIAFSSKAIIDGNGMEVITLCRDITERKRHEYEAKMHEQQLIQADKMASLGVLVSGVAHEINNPNNFVMLNIPLLRGMWEYMLPIMDEYAEEHGNFAMGKHLSYADVRDLIPELLQGIFDGSKRIENIVRELKDYARQQDDMDVHPIEINEVLNTAYILTANLIRKATNKVIFDLDEHLPAIKGNFQKLEQVIINLLENGCQAITSSDQGLFVSTWYDAKTGMVMCTIEDEGSGIDGETKKKITDPFFTTKRAKGGTGLGLAVSSKIVMQYNGTMEFASEPGKGTVVTLAFPAIEKPMNQVGE